MSFYIIYAVPYINRFFFLHLINSIICNVSLVAFMKFAADWLETCQKDRPNEDECFRNMFQGMFPYLAEGIPELGIEHFEPLLINSVQVSKGSGSLVLAGGFKNLAIKGPVNTTVTSAT